MQIKTMRYHYTPIRMTKIKNTIVSAGKEAEQLETLKILLLAMQNVISTLIYDLEVVYKFQYTLTI